MPLSVRMLNPKLQTIAELDRQDWGEPTFDSYVVRTCPALRHKPLNALTVEEVRLGIGQDWARDKITISRSARGLERLGPDAKKITVISSTNDR
ncbi:hypothetical protein FEZ63_19610, partial [Microvirga brassicacearum]